MDQQTTLRRLAPLLLVVAIALLIPVFVDAQGQPPPIPHVIEGRESCLTCHAQGVVGAPKIPSDHEGRPNESCLACHQPIAAAGEDTATPAPASTTAPTATPPSTATPTRQAAPTSTPEPTATAGAPVDQAAGGPPPIPHTLEGHENCLECHVSGESGSMTAGGPPPIPHSLVGRDNCLACHQDGLAGAPQVPGDHAGRTNETCQGCHQPSQNEAAPTATAPAEPVPTPLVYPKADDVNTCLDCHLTLSGKHADITEQWQRSIHSERDVTCADCHGGDPSATTIDGAMSPEAGYIGAPDRQDIPALCASCHADVNQMRQYDLPTDQFAKYRESVHGTRLAEGDTNVATCYDCHGGHQVLKANDPASSVYPVNVPAMCANCHANETLMEPYHIPTNQYDLYRQSVHGQALLDKQDFRAPNCATCHGTHGAAPPGFQEVANVCGSCHSATQDYYLVSQHASAEGEDAPKCVTCHGRYDVSKPSEALYQGAEPRHCGSCHTPDSPGGELATTFYDAIDSAAQAYDEAEVAIQAAKGVGMLVTAQESLLQQANTDLVTARAAQHTLNETDVVKIAGDARDAADEARAGAEAAVEATVVRRRAMVIAIAAIAITIIALYFLKRELDRRLEADM